MKRILTFLAAALLLAGPTRAQVFIPNLPAATTPLSGADLLIVSQSGVTKKVAASAVAGTTAAAGSNGQIQFNNAGALGGGNLTGDITSSGLTTSYGNVVPAAKGGAGAITGILQANGSGTVSAVTVGTGLSFSAGTLSATGGGTGTVITTGSPASGNLATFSGATSITNGNLSGDCTTAGTLAITCTKLNGVSPGAFFAGTDAANLTGTVSISRFNAGTGASTSTFLRGDGTWATPSGGGNVSNSGTPTTGALTKWASSTTLVNADLTGDVTTSGSTASTIAAGAVTLAKHATQGANTVIANVSASTATPTAAALPSCSDSAGNHLNYVSGTGFTCGTSIPATGAFTTLSASTSLTLGAITGSTQCLHVSTAGLVSGTGSDCGAGGGGASLTTANTWTATQTFSGSATTLATVLQSAIEPVTISATAATGTINFDALTQSVLYYTTAASANWTINLRGSAGTAMNTALATGQSVTVSHLVTQGATAFFNNVVQVDGATTGVTTKWQGGAPASGSPSGVDLYQYTVIKTGSATFTVLASQTPYL